MQRGYTLLEILLVIAVSAVAITVVALSFSKLNSNQALDKSTLLVVSVLNEARSLTLSSKGASRYGVHFDETKLTLFKGSVYSALDPSNVTTPLNSLVGIRNIALSGGGTSVVFERLTGSTSQPGTIELFLKESPDSFRVISINGNGLAEEN